MATVVDERPRTAANASRVLEARYLRRDRDRKVAETESQLYERVARAVSEGELLAGNAAQARRREEEFLALLSSGKFLPNSPTLMNAGSPLGQLSACFVLPVHDSMEEIFDAVRRMNIALASSLVLAAASSLAILRK